MPVRAKCDRLAIEALPTAKLQTASATFGNLSVKFVPWRVQRVTLLPSFLRKLLKQLKYQKSWTLRATLTTRRSSADQFFQFV